MQKLLLLHGAIGSKGQLEQLKNKLDADFEIHTLNFSGHGGRLLPESPFNIDMFANDVISYIDQHDIKVIDIFGYSMGGYVALYLAKYFPFRIGRIFTLATKFKWDEASAVKESKQLDANVFIEKIPAFAAELAQRHQPGDWKMVLAKTAEMITAMGKDIVLSEDDFRDIQQTVLLTVGDKDKMVSIDETINTQVCLKNGSYFIFKDTTHPLEKIELSELASKIRSFFLNNN